MRKFFYKMKNIPWVNVLIIALVSVLFIGSIVAIGSYVKNDKTTLSSLEFKRGALNDRGFYIESDQSIYTKDLIECQGLEIEPDFETIGTYQVYYYDSNKQFIGKTDKINSQTDGVYVKGENFCFAKYCRIVITPDYMDEDGNVDTERTIKFYEVAGIAGNYNISVNKNQKEIRSVLSDYKCDLSSNVVEGAWKPDTCSVEPMTTGYYFFDAINVSGSDYIVLKVSKRTLSNSTVESDGTVITMPNIYDTVTGNNITDTLGNSTADTDGDFVYIYYNVSAYSSIVFCVDEYSVDILSVYLV